MHRNINTIVAAVTIIASLGFPKVVGATGNPIQYIEGTCTGSNSQRTVTIKNLAASGAFVAIGATSTASYSSQVYLGMNQSYTFTATSGSGLHIFKSSAPVLQQSDWTVTSGCGSTPYTGPQTPTTSGTTWGTDQTSVNNAAASSGTLSNFTWSYLGCENDIYGNPTGYTRVRLTNTSSTRLFFSAKNVTTAYLIPPDHTLHSWAQDGFELSPTGTAGGGDSLVYDVPTGATMHVAEVNASRQMLDIPVPSSSNCGATTVTSSVTSSNASLATATTQTLSASAAACDSEGGRAITLTNADTSGAFVLTDYGTEKTATSDNDVPNDLIFSYIAPSQHYIFTDYTSSEAPSSTTVHIRRNNPSTTVLDTYVALCS